MHTSVLLSETIDALQVKPEGYYIDGTFGRGGHSRAVLEKLGPNGKLLAIDKDPQAIQFAQEHFAQDTRFQIEHASFADIQRLCNRAGWLGQVDGILLDLGVSSPQLDQAERGFSFREDGPLDMRMDPTQGQSVAEWLAVTDETELANILWRYGEERFSRRIARQVLAEQALEPITTTKRLADIIGKAIPAHEKKKHPATRSFQALRIFINNELGDLETFLADFDAVLKVGGRLAIISFHSLEDRLVKRCFQTLVQGPKLPRHLPVQTQHQPRYRWVAKKLKPAHNEVQGNVRSRSATLRVIEKCDLI